jgi:peptidoglycan/LPS O-acetylase OafA/YrhL
MREWVGASGAKKLCARGSDPALLCGPSTSPLGGNLTTLPPFLKTRPRSVLGALGLMAVTFVVAVVRLALMKDWAHPVPAALSLSFLAALCCLWLYGLWRRTTWLWWFTVISGIAGCLLARISVARLHDSMQISLYWVQFAMTLTAMILLVTPVSRSWYRRRAAA